MRVEHIRALRKVSRIALQLKAFFDNHAWIENGGYEAGLVADDLWKALDELSGITGELDGTDGAKSGENDG